MFGNRISTTKVYKTWREMLRRCYNANYSGYKNYGGRGIYVCSEWKEEFYNFFKDMGFPPTNKHSLDRIDNNGPYIKGNCRWATYKEQNNNRRNNHIIRYKDKVMTMAQWAEYLQMPQGSFRSMLLSGYTMDHVLKDLEIRSRQRSLKL